MKVDLDSLVLGVLARQPLHGYGIIKAIREQSGEIFKVGEGLLYPLLHRLESEGLTRADWEETQEGRPPRKVYCLTDKGWQQLSEKQREWRDMRDAVEFILRPEGI